jgi:hypothetical protein
VTGRTGGAALALAALTAGLLAAGAGGGPAPAIGANCVPVQHSKKVVKRKKVRRHGKLVTVKRRRIVRWTTCEPVALPPQCAVPSANLQVTAQDLTGSRYVLSRNCVSAGAVDVELVNEGEDPHNLFLRPVGGPDPGLSIPEDPPFELAPMGVESRTFELAAGDWYLWCDLLTHEAQGMNATLAVR